MPRRVSGGGAQPERPDEPGYGREQYGQGRNNDGQYGQGQYRQGQYEQGQYEQGQAGQGGNDRGRNGHVLNDQAQDAQWQYAQGQYGPPQNGQEQYPQGQYLQGQYSQGQYSQGQYSQGQYPQGQYFQGRNGQAWSGQERYAREQHGQEQFAQDQYAQGERGRDQSAPTVSYAAPGHYGGPPPPNTSQYQAPGRGPGDPARPDSNDAAPPRKVRFRRTRRFFRRRTVRVISAVLALFLVWLAFSVGQAALKNNGQGVSANLAEWARDHHLGPVVTFGEWLSYKAPPKGGKPSFSLAVPSGEAVTPGKSTGQSTGGSTGKSKQAFVPDIPATLKSLAPAPVAGEGQWRVAEKVNGEPAILTTFLRDATYTSEVNGIASIDQRLVKFSLRPGSEDPGPGNWGVPDYIPAGQRKGLLATFNGGFKLDSAGGGFYLNGIYHGTLVKGAASIVYEKNGTIKIGEWGRDFSMNSSVQGVRQNLKLLVDHGKVASNANLSVQSSWGATLGGGEYVWRSGIGITKDGRVVYVYGSALSAQDLAELLLRAGAVEGMQMDINPAWMKFDYYQAKSNPSDPVPVTLLPTQYASAYSYYTPSTRDFTAVYAR